MMATANCGQANVFNTGMNLENLFTPGWSAKPMPNQGCTFSPMDPHSVLETVFELPTTATTNTHAHIMSIQLMDSLEDANDDDWSFTPKTVLDHKVSTASRKVITPVPHDDSKAKVKIVETPHL